MCSVAVPFTVRLLPPSVSSQPRAPEPPTCAVRELVPPLKPKIDCNTLFHHPPPVVCPAPDTLESWMGGGRDIIEKPLESWMGGGADILLLLESRIAEIDERGLPLEKGIHRGEETELPPKHAAAQAGQ